VLNKTVCDHAQVGAVVRDNKSAVVGTYLDRQVVASRPVSMRSPARTQIWLDVSCRLCLDQDEELFLTVTSSYWGLAFGSRGEDVLLSYDYERDKDRYAEAHLQVRARHERYEQFAAELGRRDRLGRLHLPVGGRRFRPALEDVLEFLIVERLVEPKAGWEMTLDRTRTAYRSRQIAAVVRRNHGTAVTELARLGYEIIPPEDDRTRAKLARLIAPRPRAPLVTEEARRR
jgi:hypothetical protein